MYIITVAQFVEKWDGDKSMLNCSVAAVCKTQKEALDNIDMIREAEDFAGYTEMPSDMENTFYFSAYNERYGNLLDTYTLQHI